jgi:hypothetical protein
MMVERRETRDERGRIVRVDWAWDAKLKGKAANVACRDTAGQATRYRAEYHPDGCWTSEYLCLADRRSLVFTYHD